MSRAHGAAHQGPSSRTSALTRSVRSVRSASASGTRSDTTSQAHHSAVNHTAPVSVHHHPCAATEGRHPSNPRQPPQWVCGSEGVVRSWKGMFLSVARPIRARRSATPHAATPTTTNVTVATPATIMRAAAATRARKTDILPMRMDVVNVAVSISVRDASSRECPHLNIAISIMGVRFK